LTLSRQLNEKNKPEDFDAPYIVSVLSKKSVLSKEIQTSPIALIVEPVGARDPREFIEAIGIQIKAA
jgi:hypothetical protein